MTEEAWGGNVEGKATGKHGANLNIKGRRIKAMESGMESESREDMTKNPRNSVDKTNATTIKMVQLELKSE